MQISLARTPSAMFLETYGDAVRTTRPAYLNQMGPSGVKVRAVYHDPRTAYAAMRAFNDVVDGVQLVVKVPSDFYMQRGIQAVRAVRDLMSALPGVTSVGTKWAPKAATEGFDVATSTTEHARLIDALLRDEIFGRPVEVRVAAPANAG